MRNTATKKEDVEYEPTDTKIFRFFAAQILFMLMFKLMSKKNNSSFGGKF